MSNKNGNNFAFRIEITVNIGEDTKGAMARSGGLLQFDIKAAGASAWIISILSLYSGRSDAITRIEVPPCEWPMYCNFVCPVSARI